MRQESTESSSTTEMEYSGKLHFALRYDKEIEGLVVKVSLIISLTFNIEGYNYTRTNVIMLFSRTDKEKKERKKEKIAMPIN